MRWWWLHDRVKQHKFKIWWDRGINNLADYHTKHFPPSHHQHIRPTYILKGNNLSTSISYVRGCVNQPPRGYQLGYTKEYAKPLGRFNWSRKN